MSSNEPVNDGCEVIYEMFHILNSGFENELNLSGIRLYTV